MDDTYSKAYVEVLEILKHVPTESVDKIPSNIIKTFEKFSDKSYIFFLDYGKPFDQQILLDETSAILANIFRDYWATPEQRELILKKEEQDRLKLRLTSYEELLNNNE